MNHFVDAPCSQVDPELFFPEPGGTWRRAKEICGTCPYTVRCLQTALDTGVTYGIWGGVSMRNRKKLLGR